MSAKLYVSFLALAASSFVGCADRSWQVDADADLRERAEAIHRESIVLDSHNDVASFWIVDDGFDLAMDGAEDEDRSPWLHWMVSWLPGAPAGPRPRGSR